jgi:hypothetical protein
MNENPSPNGGDAGGNASTVLVSVLYALAAFLGSAAAVITALSGWVRL